MSYIGNAKTPLLLASNVRDDIVPDGIKKTFELSQEVPGGDANNVCVVRRRFLTDVLVENTDLIQLSNINNNTQVQFVVTDNYLAAALSILIPRTSPLSEDGDKLKITYSDGTSNQSLFKVDSVSYNRDSITITATGTTSGPSGTILKLERLYYGPWEILDSETQYEITSATGYTNRLLEIKDLTPGSNDLLYVLHRGEGTYNFVPSPNSVGPEQLSSNLRNFIVDVQSYNTTGAKTLTLSQVAASASTLLVTANGVVQPSTDESASGTWTLNAASGTSQTITLKSSLFTGAVANPVSVRVLHLGFSTVSRRAVFSPGQEPTFIANNSVTSLGLAESSVTTTKLSDNSVTGAKVLLGKTESLRFQTSPTTEVSVLSLDQTSNDTQVKSNGSVQIKSGSVSHNFSSSAITSGATNTVSLGTSNNKFKDLYIGGTAVLPTIQTENITITGNVTITGTIDNTDVSDLRDSVTSLQSKVNDLIKFLIPVGTIVPTAALNTPLSTTYGQWVLCDGRTLTKASYGELFQALGGESQRAAGWPWGVCDDTVFAIPDLRRRVLVAKSSDDTLGANEGKTQAERSLSHTHTGPDHTHTLTHTHTIPAHKHTIVPTEAGSLSISTSSGDHTTDIKHSHTSSTTSSANTDHVHDLSHSHTGTTGFNDAGDDHTHDYGPTTSATSHRHTLETSKIRLNTGGSYPEYTVLGGTDIRNDLMGTESTHTHSGTTGASKKGATTSATYPDTQRVGGITHKHAFSIATQTNQSDTAKVLNTATNTYAKPTAGFTHVHTVTITDTTTTPTSSSSTGSHTHPSTAFAGFIGKAADAEGNSSLATNSQSTDITSSANYGTNQTGSATIPYLIVNYMIRIA